MNDNEIIQIVIEEILKEVLPESFYRKVSIRKWCLSGGSYIAILACPSNYRINNVPGQYPEIVSLCFDISKLELTTQIFGGMGGGGFYRKIRPDLFSREKYNAQGFVKVPFRKPKAQMKAIYSAIRRFFERYLALLIEWGEDLRYKEHGDYSFLNKAIQGDS